jgi:hypothetical protein
VHLLNPRPTHPPAAPPLFFWYVCGRFLARGVQKHHTNIFTKKSMSKTFPKKVDKNFDVSFTTFFVLSRFRVFLSDGSSKTLQKTFYKKIVSKSFYKKSTKNPKSILSRFFYLVFGRFSVRGVQKHYLKNISPKKSDPGPFLASDPPTHHGGHRFFWGGPLPSDLGLQQWNCRLL